VKRSALNDGRAERRKNVWAALAGRVERSEKSPEVAVSSFSNLPFFRLSLLAGQLTPAWKIRHHYLGQFR